MLFLSLRLEGPHHYYSDPTWATKPNHHTEPHGPRSSSLGGVHLPGAALQLTGESAGEDKDTGSSIGKFWCMVCRHNIQIQTRGL